MLPPEFQKWFPCPTSLSAKCSKCAFEVVLHIWAVVEMNDSSRLVLYNQVVAAYNQLGPLVLTPVPTSPCALDTPRCVWLGYFLLALLPGLNLLLAVFLCLHLVQLWKEIRITRENRRTVPDPFEHMQANSDLSLPFLSRVQLPSNRMHSGNCTVASDSLVHRSSEPAERMYYRPDMRAVYDRMLLSACCSCVFAWVLVLVSVVSLILDLCWVADQEGLSFHVN